MIIKVTHDRKQCIGCGTCVAVCPKCFEIDKEDNLADLKNSNINSENLEELIFEDVESIDSIAGLEDAIAFCPVKTIKLEK